MISNSSDLFFADERRSLLLADAAHDRLVRQAQPANGAGSRLFGRLGDALISLGYGLKGEQPKQGAC